MPLASTEPRATIHDEKAGRRVEALGPPLLLAVGLDAILGATVYLLAYWLRFQDGELHKFLPSALATDLLVVGCQLGALALGGAYRTRDQLLSVPRLGSGAVLGTAAASGLVWVTVGYEGVSRIAFAVDAVLFAIAAVSWRTGWLLLHRPVEQRHADGGGAGGELVDRAAELTTVKGAVISLYRYRELLKNLVLKELKLKYRGSVFGFLWSLANPLLMMIVYTLAFTVILRIRNEGFVFSLMLGLLSWTFFANSAGLSTGAIVDNSGLLKSVLFPRSILPIGTVLFNLVQYLLTISVFLPAMMLWYQVAPAPPMLLFPLFLLLQVVFTIGVALMLATATAFFRDVRHLLEVALAVLFWTTPIVYELNQVPERFKTLILLSPVSPFVVAYQEMFYYRSWPGAPVYFMAGVHALGAFFIGTLLFLNFEDRFTEQL